MKKLFLLLALLGIFSIDVFSQATNDYRSNGNGNWGTLSTWQRYNGSTWATPTAGQGTPTSASGVISIRSPHTVTVAAGVTVDQVVVEAGGQITVGGATLTVANGTGTDLNVNGTVATTASTSANITVNSGAAIVFNAGSTYNHARTTGTIPTATWDPNSTLLISGTWSGNNMRPTYGNQVFGNVTFTVTTNGSGSNLGETSGTASIVGTLTISIPNSSTQPLSFAQPTMNVGNLVINSGWLTMGGGVTARIVNVLGNTTINGGIFDLAFGANATADQTLNLFGSLTLAGTCSLTVSSAGVDAGSYGDGIINFAGNSVQTFSKTGGTISCLTASHFLSFNVNDGATVDFGTSILDEASSGSNGDVTFTLASGGRIISANAAGLTTSGNAGSIQVGGTRTYNAGAHYTYNGSSAQATGNGLPSTLSGILEINNAAGVTLSQSITSNGTLNLLNGALLTGANNLNVNGIVNRTNGVIVGNLVKTLSASGPYTFEVGTSSTKYTPVVLNNVVGSGTFMVSAVAGAHPNAAGTNVLQMYWQLTNNGITTADLTFNYLDADVVGDENQYELGRYDGTWAYISPITLNTTNNTASIAGIDSFSDWTLGEDGELPVELSSFTYTVNGSTVKLNWRTTTEVNNFGFEIERVSNNSELSKGVWEKIGFVEGNGNTNSPKEYSYNDESISAGKYSYRLKQIDIDGQFEYSKTVEVDLSIPTVYALDQNYPNPFNPVTNIRYSLPAESNVVLKIFDVLGNEVQTLVSANQPTGVYTVQFDSKNIASGTYVYRIQVGDQFVQSKKMIVIK